MKFLHPQRVERACHAKQMLTRCRDLIMKIRIAFLFSVSISASASQLILINHTSIITDEEE